MLIPRFSMRLLLAAMTASALFCYVVAMAIRGHNWAIAVSIATTCLAVQFAVYATTFLSSWVPSLVISALRRTDTASPFATMQPPPQIIPPEDPE